MRIVLDTNILFDDPMMNGDAARRVLDLLAPAEATLVFSPVVVAELNRKRTEDLQALHATITSRLKRLGRMAKVKPDPLLGETTALLEMARDRWTGHWNRLLSEPHVEEGTWPEISSQMMAEREFSRRRPFLDKEPGTIGHRDTLIWLGVVELARQDDEDEIVFVTADKGFLDNNGLHADLLDDLDGADGLVTHLTSLPALVTVLQKELERTGWDAWREPAVSETVYNLIQSFVAEDFVEHWNPRDGGTSPPEFDIGLPFTGHDWVLTAYDGPQDLSIEDADYGASELICTFVLDLHFSGFMEKSEWFADDHPEVDLWDADWNDQVVSIETERRVRYRVRLDIDDTEEWAVFGDFLEVAAAPDLGNITIG